jgi:hypothetical protein
MFAYIKHSVNGQRHKDLLNMSSKNYKPVYVA